MNKKDYYTVKEFAEKLEVSCNTVRNYIHKGIIPAYKLGRTKKSHFRIHIDELNNFIETMQVF